MGRSGNRRVVLAFAVGTAAGFGLLIAVPSASEEQMQRLVSICETTGVEFRTLPGAHELLSGRVQLTDMREVRIEDLLGRDPVALDNRGHAPHDAGNVE